MNMENVKTNVSLAGGLGLALLGTTCCALPIVLVALGMGSVMASLVSALPWLGPLSQYKGITFAATALVLAYSGWRLHRARRADHCSVNDGRRLKWQKRLFGISIVIFLIALFAAYALVPIATLFE